MKVILLAEIRGKGGEGDVVEVATGFAVNYLFPKKLAIAATSGNLKQLEQRRHNIAKRESERLDTADKLMAALEGRQIKIATKVGEEGQLFGSITTIQIAEAMQTAHGIDVDRKQLDTHGLIKTVGEHDVTVSIYRDVKATIKVVVVDEKAAPVEEEAEEAAEVEAEAAEAGEAAEMEAEAAEAGEAEAAEVAADAETEAAEAAADAEAAEEASKEAPATEAD